MVSDRVTSQPYHVTAIKQAAPEPRRSGGIALTDPRRRAVGGEGAPRSTTPRTTRACVCKTITRIHAFARGEHAVLSYTRPIHSARADRPREGGGGRGERGGGWTSTRRNKSVYRTLQRLETTYASRPRTHESRAFRDWFGAGGFWSGIGPMPSYPRVLPTRILLQTPVLGGG